MNRTMNIFLSLFLTFFLFSCGGGGGGGGTKPTNPSAKTLTKIDISADTAGTKARAEANPSTPLGISTQYSAIATYNDNTTVDITDLATWSSSDSNVATVDKKGLVKTLKVSATEITASYQGVTSNKSELTIVDAIATKITVIPPTAKLAKGLSLQLQAIATFSDDSTKDVSTQASWQSNKPTVLKVDAKGKLTALALGDAIVSATLQGITGHTSVSSVNLTVSKIQITPAKLQLAKGTKAHLTAVATFNDKSVQDVSSQVAWLSSSIAVATVDNTGLVTGVATGSTTLSASLLGVTASTSVKITNASLKTLQVIPAVSSIALGTKTQLRAIATFTDNSSQNVSGQVQWNSSDASVASVSSLGLVTGRSTGQVSITATLGSISRSTTVTVTNAVATSIQITPATSSLPKGTTQQFQAIATFSDSSSQDVSSQVYWDSSNINVATIDLNGELTALAEGNSIISARIQNVSSNQITLEVTSAVINEGGLTITVPPLTLAAGQSSQLAASGTYSDGITKDITADVHWSSSNPTIATVSLTGQVTAVTPGSATIIGLMDGQSATVSVTATNATLNAGGLTITVPPLSLAAGLSSQLTANGAYSDGTSTDVTASVQWSSSDPAIATVSLTGLVTAVAPGTATITGTLDGQTAILSVTVTNATLNAGGLTISTPPLSLAAGQSSQLAASGTYSDGSTINVTANVQWSSDNPAVATVSQAGLVTAVNPGIATVTGTLDGQTATLSVTVSNAVLNVGGLTITTPPLTLAAGLTGQLAATGSYSDGSSGNVTSSVSWTSSNPAVATVGLHTGLVTAVVPGTATITGTLDGQSATLPLTVTSAVLNSGGLTITTPPLTLAAGLTGQLTATGSYSDGSNVDVTASVTWASTNPAVATVNASGLVTGVAPGTATITGILDGQTTTLSVTVSNAVLNVGGLTIATPPLTLAAGLTSQLAATGSYSDGSSVNVTASVIWVSSNPAAATVNASGLVTGVAPGTAIITGTLDGQTATLSVTVTSAVLNSGGLTITTPPLTLAAGLTGQLAATGSYSDGSSVNVTASVTWVSSNPAVATVNTSGLVTGVAPGTATITGTLDGQTATLTATVSNAVLNVGGLTITTPPLTLAAGLTGQLAATGSYSDGSSVNVTASVIWVSSNPAVATVSASGLVTAVAPGTATITGTLDGQAATLAVTITSAVLNASGLTITVPPLTLVTGLTGQLAATGSYSDGSSVNVTNTVSWTTNNPIVATVGLNTGLVTGILPGTATITGTLDGQTATLQVTVTSATLNPGGLAITTPPLALAAGLTGQLAATGSYSNGSTVNVTTSVNWSSSNPAVATASASGLVTAVAPGTTTITGTLDGQAATLLVTVTSAILNPGGLTITVPPLNLAAGLTGQLAANGTYSNGASVDVTTNVSWTTNNPLVAAVGLNTGLVTSVLPGTASITATLDGQSTTVLVTVSNAVVTSVSIDPVNPLAAGTTAQLKATASLSNLTTLDVTAQANWQSSDPSVFTVTSTGLATGVVPGNATVSVNVQGMPANQPVVINNAMLTSIAISQSGLNLSPLLSTITFTAIGHYSDGSTQNITSSVNWKINGGLLTLGLGNTYVFLLNGNSHFTAELNGVTSNTLSL